MIQFTNTEIAFKSKSDKALSKAWWLFKIMASPFLVKTLSGLTKAALAVRFPVAWAVRPTIYSHFVGGRTIDESTPMVRLLDKFNVRAILDYSVEGGETEAAIDAALQETLRTIHNAGKDKNIPFAVFKPTAFVQSEILEKAGGDKSKLTETEKKQAAAFKERVNLLCKTAYDAGIPILIDAEDSWYQDFIDETVEEMMRIYNKEKAVVFNTWQMYRHDRLEHLKKWYERAVAGNFYVGAKFVRGAYMEKERARAAERGYPSPIQPDKAATDKAYDDALQFTFEHLDRFAIFNGTHNEHSSKILAEWMIEKGIARDDNRIWFSQLCGMSDHISFNLAAERFNVAKYLPYGPIKHVLPYLFRRATENTSVKGQTGRELMLLTKERQRRKSKK
jgi:proline dehydrogenase